MGIYGKEPDLQIQGMMLWKGTEVHPYMKEHPSFEYYEVKQIDLEKEDQREKLIAYWTRLQDTDLYGIECADVKVWKWPNYLLITKTLQS